VIEVSLSPEEVAKAANAARAVNENKNRVGKPHKSWGPTAPDEFTSRSESFKAELAVAKALGLDHGWEIFDGGDGRVDIRLPHPVTIPVTFLPWSPIDVQTIQVKYRGEPFRDLATEGLNFWRELKADIYILVWPGQADDSLLLVGWCTRDQFVNRIFSRPPVRMLGDKYEMRWEDDLNPIDSLVEGVKLALSKHASEVA